MKFYQFTDCDYPAIIWAKDEEQAKTKYSEDVCEIDKDYIVNIFVEDVDEVFKLMKKIKPNGDEYTAEIGYIGVLYRTITSQEPEVVLMWGF